jgi:hypothetical protein
MLAMSSRTSPTRQQARELIVAVKGSDNNIAAIEDATDQELTNAGSVFS